MGILRYQLEVENDTKEGARLLYASTSRYEKDWNSIRHTHGFSELFYVTGGCGRFFIDDREILVSPDDMIIINPQLLHTESSLLDKPLEYITLGIDGISFSFGDKKDYALFHCRSLKKELSFYFSSLFSELEKKEPGCQDICKNLLEILLIQLGRLSTQAFEIVPVSKASQECSKIKRYIDANYSRELTLESLACMAHLNKYYFAHSFSSAYGISPMSYLTGRRLQAASELLLTTDYSIGQIARLSGFSSQSYFSQAFRRYFGTAAGNYRREAAPENRKTNGRKTAGK